MIGYNLRQAMKREHFDIKPIDKKAKYEVGKEYWCGYWSQSYEVEKVNYEDNNLKGVLVLWDDGRKTAHCTPLDPKWDYEIVRGNELC